MTAVQLELALFRAACAITVVPIDGLVHLRDGVRTTRWYTWRCACGATPDPADRRFSHRWSHDFLARWMGEHHMADVAEGHER